MKVREGRGNLMLEVDREGESSLWARGKGEDFMKIH